MRSPERQQFRLPTGRVMSFVTAGEASKPPILLLHGFPSSSRTFRDIIPGLAGVAQVIAPDLPGFGESDVLPAPSFGTFAEMISLLLEHLGIGPRYVYLHDFGAPVGFEIAMRAPEAVLGLVIQNANAHATGQGPAWAATQAFWRNPSRENEAEATAHLTFEGIRAQYVAGVPDDIACQIQSDRWEEDWRVMQLPGRIETQRALIADYGNYVSKFGAIADYLACHQPASLMVWGRHDPFFDLREILSWMEALPRTEAHILDGGHFLLETHAAVATRLIAEFLIDNR
ncbi:pimeloyl-ACP methyl ester carboxylesterase [Rhizobium sp. BK650]|uniref:alpha/beta fold hydrolase n=1 Tax=Rhizobium sp. BK650 TaxID=2586990 RepID=UPI00161D1D8D|nr:alpha/beta hydrolase [Rhizobium sp. BK650]MBB3656436.1 pimeloyl-ACP methyl ester carboxylesterase [Rhizobium sp. BK650]